jgi:serine/threonine protein kinase
MLKLEKDQILLSRFSLIRPLGEGAMGQVWLVRDLELQVDIAIKALNPRLLDLPGRIDLLKNECRNTRRLSHPNIVRVFDFHRTPRGGVISMEYIEGQDLVAYRRNLQYGNYVEMLSLLQPITDALAYAHQMGLVHRDVKSSNILIDTRHTPHLTDFGIAGVFKSGSDALDITSGGSLYSMSPQQLEGIQPRPSDDIYALGVLMYELLTGSPPFYPDITADKIRTHRPPPVNRRLADLQLSGAVPILLEDLIDQMLAKTAGERPADMQTISRSLLAIDQRTTTQTVPPAAGVQGSPANRRHQPTAKTVIPMQVSTSYRTKQGPEDARRHNFFKILVLVTVFAGLIAGGGLLLYFLSKHPLETTAVVDPQPEPQVQAEKKAAQPPQKQPEALPDATGVATDPAQTAQQRQAAEQKLAEYTELKNELDHRGAEQWGGEAYVGIRETARQADTLLMDQAYPLATEKYSEAIAGAGALKDQAGEALERLLQEGQTALDQGDGPLAQEKFSTALMIDPANALAQKGLQRSKTIEEVMQLMATGKQHEENNRLSVALADYQAALDLDPEAETAQAGLKRVKSKIRDQEFQRLISQGLAAYHSHDYRLARTKLLKAKSFKPDSREVRDALIQVDTAIRLSQIEKFKQEALASADAEAWARALDAYLQILKIDPTIQFAIQGKQQSLQHIQIEKRIDFFLNTPGILENDKQMENAVKLLQETNAVASRGPKLSTRLDKLEKLIIDAQTPVKVVIESDSLTDIAVYRLGKLGRFAERELDLKPGTYTVVGARDGYKDIRRKIVIKAGQKPMRIVIKCTVKI